MRNNFPVTKIVTTVPAALNALAAMERQLDSKKTYEEIRRIQREAEALKVLLGHVDEVRKQSEWVILEANARIGEELKKIPKASGGDRKSNLPRGGNLKSGKEAVMPKHTSRSRLQKLADMVKSKRKEVANKLWEAGKNATIKGVLGEAKEVQIKEDRKDFEERRDQGSSVIQLESMLKSGTKFPVIYADPPWEFKVYSGKGKQRSAERHYDTMPLDEIKKLPIESLAAKDCALFLWSVWPELPGALEVIRAWGFEYKTAAFVWVKTVSEKNEDSFTGMGYWTRANSEVCLLATRGSPQRDAKDVHQIVSWPIMDHSVKPEEVRKRIERLIIGPYLELFARKSVPGWSVWGNEVNAEAAE